jgi:NAD(P)-dependent dehydrogenase (short-subunit alcohol dehydrogenase family)
MADGRLAGMHALVLGGSAGIGHATARAFHADGATVTITGRRADQLAAAAAAIGPDVRTAVGDGSTAEGVLAAIDVAADGGRLHMAVTIPGGGGYSPVLAFDEADFMAQIDRNVRPAFLAIRHCGRHMAERGGGAIVCVSSTAAIMSSRYLAAYGAAKAAVDQLVRVAADEVGRYGVRVNAVRPGLTRTETTEGMLRREGLPQQFLALQPIGRHGEAEDIAAAIRHLAGPESGWTTGQCLTVDGGQTLRMFPDTEPMVRRLLGDAVFDDLPT